MAYCCSYKCCDVIFDIYDTERIPVERPTENRYYITPDRCSEIEKWMVDNLVLHINSKAQLSFIIEKDWLAVY